MQSCTVPCCVPNPGTTGNCCQLGRAPGPHPNGTLAVPTELQLAWQDFEVGSLNSFQMVTFWGGQLKADRPFNLSSPAEFTANKMDTDQWAQAVAEMGGKYQVLNVKDESGFLLWPTNCTYQNGTVYPYSVASSPSSTSNGDLLERFVASNKRHGIRSGIYYLGWGNFFMNITNSGGVYDCSVDTSETREFIDMQLCHLQELYSQYEFSEIWFDGGAPCLKRYEDAIANLTLSYQGNNAVAFQGPTSYPNNIRWVGTEAGVAPPDTWSATESSQTFGAGLKNGQVWAPAESDTCIRTADCCAPGGEPADSGSAGCWVWYPNTTQSVKSPKTLRDSYLKTVGRNSNLLLNISPNTDGTIDKVDMAAYKQLGEWIAKTFGRAVKEQNDTVLVNNSTVLDLTGVSDFTFISIMEEQHHGQRIWGWKLEGKRAESEQWELLSRGGSIGHKRIINCAELTPAPAPNAIYGDSWPLRHQKIQDVAVADPPAPPAQSGDVLFTACEQAHGWIVEADGTVRATINSSTSSIATSVGEQVCLTLDGPPVRFQFVSAKPCRSANDRGASQQRWKLPWKPGQPALAFAGRTANTHQCIQILGDSPWTGQRAVVWDCQENSADEHFDELPTTSTGVKLKIDMSSYGGGPLCMAVRAAVAPPPPPASCEGIQAIRFSVTESASSSPAALRQLAVY